MKLYIQSLHVFSLYFFYIVFSSQLLQKVSKNYGESDTCKLYELDSNRRRQIRLIYLFI